MYRYMILLHKYLIVHIDIILYILRSPCIFCITVPKKIQNYKTSGKQYSMIVYQIYCCSLSIKTSVYAIAGVYILCICSWLLCQEALHFKISFEGTITQLRTKLGLIWDWIFKCFEMELAVSANSILIEWKCTDVFRCLNFSYL